ncbi:MAG: hypothetical protein AAFV62_00330 [Pseudomonadota bacterium]
MFDAFPDEFPDGQISDGQKPGNLGHWSFESAATRAPGYVRFDADAGSDTLWVVFSHADKPEGVFVQTRVLRGTPGAKLFLNCADNGWFLDGVTGLTTSLAETIEWIRNAAEGRFTQLRFVGHSMGAYAALVAGATVEGSKVIATSPEWRLGVPKSRSARNGHRPHSVRDWASLFHGQADGVVLFGAQDPVDAAFIAEAKAAEAETGLRVYEVASRHGTTEHLAAAGQYSRLLQGGVDAAEALVGEGHLYRPFTHGTAAQYRAFFAAFQALKSKAPAARLRAAITDFPGWTNPGWQHLRAQILSRLGDRPEALTAAEDAVSGAPDSEKFRETLTALIAAQDERLAA